MSGDRPGRVLAAQRGKARESSEHESCEQDAVAAVSALDKALRRAFWLSLHRSPLPAMLALERAARTVGVLYRQVAQAHEGAADGRQGACSCGWEPDPDGDLIVLEANLAAALLQPSDSDLSRMPAAGRA